MQLNEYNKLSHLQINFSVPSDSQTINYDVDIDLVESFQLDFSNESMVTSGSLIIDDQAFLNQFIQFSDQIVTIEYMDIFEEITRIKSRILNVNHVKYGNNQTGYEILLQDEFSYALQNSFLGRSYQSGNFQDVVNDFQQQLGVDLSARFVTGNLRFDTPLVVPKHINNLKFFEDELLRMGQSFQGKRDRIQIYTQDDVIFSNLPEDDVFTEVEKNQNYKNRIHEVRIKELIRDKQFPKFETFDYDNRISDFHKNDDNSINDYSLNAIKNSVIDTRGLMPVYERITSHKERLRRQQLKSYGLDIVVSGYCYREVNVIQDVILQGNKQAQFSRDQGDTVNSGKYLISAIQDRYIGGSLLQKLYLRRPDSGEVISPSTV